MKVSPEIFMIQEATEAGLYDFHALYVKAMNLSKSESANATIVDESKIAGAYPFTRTISKMKSKATNPNTKREDGVLQRRPRKRRRAVNTSRFMILVLISLTRKSRLCLPSRKNLWKSKRDSTRIRKGTQEGADDWRIYT